MLQDMLASSRRPTADGHDVAIELPKTLDSNPHKQMSPDIVSVHCTDSGFTTSPSIKTTFSGDTLSDSSSVISSRPSVNAFGSNHDKVDDNSKDGSCKSSSTWRLPMARAFSVSHSLSNPSIGNLDRKKMEDDSGVLYDLYFTVPPKLTAGAAIRYHLTTRNVLAFLLDRSIVGLNFAQALRDLQRRLEIFLPPQTNCAKLIVRYLVRKRLHNVSNNPSTAAGLLAWSEDIGVRWLEGWREAFVHCCGMYTRLAETPEYECISEVSKGLLEAACSEMQSRLRTAEKRLLTFKFDDTWLPLTISSAASNTTATNNDRKVSDTLTSNGEGTGAGSTNQLQQARASFDSFRQFLRQHYEKAYKSWRTRVAQENCNDSWLTRKLTRELQADFGALYDYLVDRDAVWGPGGDIVKNIPAGRGQRVDFVIATPATASKNDSNNNSVAQMLRLLRHYDYRFNHPALLYPFPLLPVSVPVEFSDGQDGQQATPRRGLHVFTMSKTTRARDKRVHTAYASANNAHFYSSSSSVKQHDTGSPNPLVNPLVEAFRKHEKSEQTRSLDPRSARVGRWIMLYSILQVLAGISVDTPHLFFNDVPYFLNPRLSNTPPWANEDQKRQPSIGKMVVGIFDEASRLYSYCWIAPKRWRQNGQMNGGDKRDDNQITVPAELTDSTDFVTAPPMLLRTRSKRDGSFAISSPGTNSVANGTVSDDSKMTKDMEMAGIEDVGAVDTKSIHAEDGTNMNNGSASAANIPLPEGVGSRVSASNPLPHDSASYGRVDPQSKYCNGQNPHSTSDENDHVDEEVDEDFNYFNNISHERQGMPGFRAPLKAAIARSRSRSFIRTGTDAAPGSAPGLPRPPPLQRGQTVIPVHTVGQASLSQSSSTQSQNTSHGSERPTGAEASISPSISGGRADDGSVVGGAKIQNKQPSPASRPGPTTIPMLRAASDTNVVGINGLKLKSMQSVMETKEGLANGISIVGKSDYAPPVEW